MYVAAYGVGGFKETLAKVRKTVHRIFPRELSPSRLAEKFATDSKKKGAAKLQAVSAGADARDAAAQVAYDKQIALISSLAPVGSSVSQPLPFMSSPKSPPTMPAESWDSYVPYIAGGTLLLAVLLLPPTKGKRR